jgi:hypothetical protein
MRLRAFTILEMLVATVLVAVLLGGVLSASALLARDARKPRAMSSSDGVDAAFELIRRDITNSTMLSQDGGAAQLTLTGHAGLDRRSLQPTGRLTRVSYAVRRGAGLVRSQRYLDDAVRPQPWSELVLAGVTRIEASSSASASHGVNVRIEFRDGSSTQRLLVR